MKVPFIFRLFWIAPMLAGALVALNGVLDLQRAEQSTQWQAVEGVLEEVHRSDGSLFGNRGSWGRYAWEVDGARYVASDISCCGHPWRGYIEQRTAMEQRTAANPANDQRPLAAGQPVTVYPDPENPARAVLQPGVQPRCWFPVIVGIGLLVVGAVLRQRILTDAVRRTSGF